MHNVSFTEYRLMLMKVSNGKCIICGQYIEALKHVFCECKTVKSTLRKCKTVNRKFTSRKHVCFKLHGARNSQSTIKHPY